VKGLDRDFVTIKLRVEEEGYGFVSHALVAFGKRLDSSLAAGYVTPFPGFSRNRGSSLPKFLWGLTSNIFDDETGLLLKNPSIECVKTLRELVFLFRKLKSTSDQEISLDRKAKLGFIAHDNAIPDLHQGKLRFLEHVSRVCLAHMELSMFSEQKCKHGPGSVSEKYKPNQKWLALYSGLSEFDHRLMNMGYDLWSFSKDPIPFIPRLHPSSNSARLISVAKTSVARRTITIEPMLNQFVQQGLNTMLREEISSNPILSECLTLDDQTPNQKLAKVGSITGEYATIDLSSASDLLGLELVKKVFQTKPQFLAMALDCRSGFIAGNDNELRKFAGMGNALTFPIQSIVFAILSIAATLYDRDYVPTYRQIKAAARTVRVYGDDIIVRSRSYTKVVDWLSCFGLKVNQDKSFSTGNFRESCGKDYFMGYDVTPVYLRYKPDVTSFTASALENFVSVSNQCWLSGRYSFSTYLKGFVESTLRKALPLVSFSAGCLGWHTRQNLRSSTKWNSNLHRFEVKSLVRSSTRVSDPIDGYAALLKFFHVPLLGRPVGHLEVSERRFTLKHRWRWVQA
jgi:hypothetical protein